MTEFFSPPDDTGGLRASELHTSLGERLGAQFGEAFFGGTRTLTRIGEYNKAELGDEPLDSQIERLQRGEDLADVVSNPQRPPDVPIADAKARVKQEGLEGRFKLPDQDTVKQPVLDLMIQHAHERDQLNAAVNRGPQGFLPGALGMATEIGAGLIDPVNIAAFSIPVVGEARLGMVMARAGEGAIARAGVRAGVGAAQGAIGTTLLQPADWWLHTRDGVDYTMADALHSIVLGAGMGGVFHAGLGAIGDIRARRPGLPLEGTAPGGTRMTPENAPAVEPGRPLVNEPPSGTEVPGISAGEQAPAAPHPEGAAPAGEGAPADLEFAPLPHPSELPPDHPASILADLPPRAREDVTRAAIADVINGNAVRGAELLHEAGKAEPRIAQSIEAWHGSPHDFDRFDMAKVGGGEGAQSYGHGLYFAEQPKVAEGYRARLSGEAAEANPAAYADPDIGPVLREAEAGYRSAEEDLVRAANSGDQNAISEAMKRKGDAFGYLEGARREADQKYPPGALYRVRIKADREHFLDWDKPLSEQSPHVQAALGRLGIDVERVPRNELGHRLGGFHNEAAAHRAAEGEGLLHYRVEKNATGSFDVIAPSRESGKDIYQSLIKHRPRQGGGMHSAGMRLADLDKTPEAASAALRREGIVGIRYFDQGSRRMDAGADAEHTLVRLLDAVGGDREKALKELEAREAGGHAGVESNVPAAIKLLKEGWQDPRTRNLVLFDDKHVEITHKNGEPVSRGERQELLREKRDNPDGATVLQGPRAARGPRARDPETWSLNEFLASRGGLDPTDPLIGDVRHSIGPSNKFVPGFGHLIRKGGMRLDQAREAAVEAGYLIDKGDITGRESQTSVRTLLDAVDQELRGQRVYRAGREPEAAGPSREQHVHQIESAIDGAFHESGLDVARVPDTTMARVVEIMDREGVRDPLIAYERAVMEETQHGAEIGQHERVADTIPGWDVPDDTAAASRPGGAAPLDQSGAGGAARYAGAGDRAAGDARRVAAGADATRLPQLPEGARIVEHGDHGPVVEGLQGRWIDAVEWLRQAQSGDARGVLEHPQVPGPIDVIWGDGTYGLAHIERLHPEVMPDLPERLARMRVEHVQQAGKPGERIVLQSPDGRETAIVRTSFDGEDKTWLLTAYTPESDRRGGGTTGSPPEGPTRSSGSPAGGSVADRASALKPDWDRLAQAKRPDDADLAGVSRQAERTPEPESTVPEKAPSAAQRAAADAEAQLKDLLPRLTEEERVALTEALDALEADRAQREQIVREGTECLLGALA